MIYLMINWLIDWIIFLVEDTMLSQSTIVRFLEKQTLIS